MQMRTTLFHSVSPFSQNQTAFLDVKNGENVWRKKLHVKVEAKHSAKVLKHLK